MSNELLEMVLDELPDAFRRHPGTAVDKVRAYVKFSSQQSEGMSRALAALPDSLNRPLDERIRLLLQRANEESELAVKLRNLCEELKPGSSSHL